MEQEQQVERKTVIIPVKKETLEKIRKKYNNMEIDEATALKIKTLEVINSVFKTASIVAGVAFVIDLFIPDELPFLDEALLGGLTKLTDTVSEICENKINDLATTGDAEMQKAEANKIAKEITSVAKKAKANKDKRDAYRAAKEAAKGMSM